MARQFYLELGQAGLRFPIGTDLVLAEEADPESVRKDGAALGRVVERAARRYRSPLAIPLMDLRLEKADLLRHLGIAESELEQFHFRQPPEAELIETLARRKDAPFAEANRAHQEAIRYIACHTDLVPVGMTIGPFSLMTKLVEDPISAVALAGMGLTGEEEPAVRLAEGALELAEIAVARSVAAQIAGGARAIIVCEPAANAVYLSPRQIAAGADIFERFVLEPNLRLKRQMGDAGVDLIFHDCGELTDAMVEAFGRRLHPVMLSLGSSRRLWEDAARVPLDVVLYGNLPTKTFYSDARMPLEEVERLTSELLERMAAAEHPFILGSECDVLSVPEAHETIRRKVEVMLNCSCRGAAPGEPAEPPAGTGAARDRASPPR
jgi:uroporphyrinogen-III decarboxylase